MNTYEKDYRNFYNYDEELTNVMTPKKIRLSLYKKALSDYRKAYYFGWLFLNIHFKTCQGLCFYFRYYGISLFYLTELDILRPEEYYRESRGMSHFMLTSYWFAPGDRISRIKLLKRAIKLIKNRQYEHN